MKKFVFLLAFLLLATYGYSAEVSKQDWEEYQQYKKEKAEKVVNVSDEEYEQYQQYLKEKEQKEGNINQDANTEEKDINNEELNKEEIAESSSQRETKSKTSENEIILKFGKILTSSMETELENTYYGTSDTIENTSSDGWKFRAEYFHYIAKNTALGCGIDYETNFESDETNIFDIDFLIKQRFPLRYREKTYLYLSSGFGYGTTSGETKGYIDEYYYLETKGGFHFIFSFGIDFTPFIIDLSYSYNNVDVKTNVPYGKVDVNYYSLILSLCYKFTI